MATSLKASGNAFNNNNMRNIESVITFLIHKEMLHSENSVKEFFKSCYWFICKCCTKIKFLFHIHVLYCNVLKLVLNLW